MAMWVEIVALVLAVLNWLIFVIVTFLNDVPLIGELLRRAAAETVHRQQIREPGAGGLAVTEQHGLDPKKLLDATGSLAGAFKKAGAAPTAAAMSLGCLIVAAIAAGIGKF